MKITNTLRLSSILAIGMSLTSCFGNGTATPSSTTQYGILQASNQPTTYNSAQLQTFFVNNIVNAGMSPTSEVASTNPSNLVLQFGNSAKNALGQGISTSPTVTAYAIKYNTPGINANTVPADISRSVSGLVLLPESGTPIKGIVLYYHPTETAKNQVPSCMPESNFPTIMANVKTTGIYPHGSNNNFAYCNSHPEPAYYMKNSTNVYIGTLGATFAANGYIVVAPDYVGMGNDYSTMHPYAFWPQNSALSGIYMLGAAKTLLQKIAYPNISFNGNTKLFVTGFSEGGGYALNTSQQLQNNMAGYLQNLGLHLTITAPAEGVYDAQAQLDFNNSNLQDGLLNGGSATESDLVNCYQDDNDNTVCEPSTFAKNINSWHIGNSLEAALAKPILISYGFTAFAYYELGNQAAGYNQIMNPAFWQNIQYIAPNPNNPMNIESYVFTKQYYNTLELYNNPSMFSTNSLSTAYHSLNMINPKNGQKYNTSESTQTTIYYGGLNMTAESPITIPPLPTGNGLNNAADALIPINISNLPLFQNTIKSATIWKWKTTSPINFINLNYDSVVTVFNESIAYAGMKQMTPDLISRTPILNFQISNDITQYLSSPLNPDGSSDSGAISWYWSSAPIPASITSKVPEELKPFLDMLGVPIDHLQASPFLAIAALSIFDKH